jgi:hypothetical protein
MGQQPKTNKDAEDLKQSLSTTPIMDRQLIRQKFVK